MVNVLSWVEERIASIVAPVYQNGHTLPRDLKGMAEVRLYTAELTQIQKKLRALKSELNGQMKVGRLQYSNARMSVSHPFLGFFGGKKRAGHLSALERQDLRTQEHNALAPYKAGVDRVDTFLRLFDGVKLDIQRQVVAQRKKP